VSVAADGQELEPDRVAELAEQGKIQLVDVRTDAEYTAGHLAGARHIPFEELTARVGELDRSRPLLLYCRSGGRSAAATQAFSASGWEAQSMAGGLVEWADRGHPLEPENGHVAETSGLPDQPTST
jgi:Rhodanese-related sulfurtransferase